MTLALGDCLADAAMLRAESALLGQWPRTPVISRLVARPAGDAPRALKAWLARPGRRLAYSAGFTISGDIADAILAIAKQAWTPADDAAAWPATARGSPSSPAC